jgi:hypothetical protein
MHRAALSPTQALFLPFRATVLRATLIVPGNSAQCLARNGQISQKIFAIVNLSLTQLSSLAVPAKVSARIVSMLSKISHNLEFALPADGVVTTPDHPCEWAFKEVADVAT